MPYTVCHPCMCPPVCVYDATFSEQNYKNQIADPITARVELGVCDDASSSAGKRYFVLFVPFAIFIYIHLFLYSVGVRCSKIGLNKEYV